MDLKKLKINVPACISKGKSKGNPDGVLYWELGRF